MAKDTRRRRHISKMLFVNVGSKPKAEWTRRRKTISLSWLARGHRDAIEPRQQGTMTTGVRSLHPGQILTGPLFNEPMRVETEQPNGPASWVVGLVGTQSERFRKGTR